MIMDNIEDIDTRDSGVSVGKEQCVPSRISGKKTLTLSYENTNHVLSSGEKLIRLVEKEYGDGDHPLIVNITVYLERLELKRKELLRMLRILD